MSTNCAPYYRAMSVSMFLVNSLENVELGGAVAPVLGVCGGGRGGHPAVHQHDLNEDALVAEVTQTLDVVAHVAAQPLGPALLGVL